MRKVLFLFIIFFIPFVLFSQETAVEPPPDIQESEPLDGAEPAAETPEAVLGESPEGEPAAGETASGESSETPKEADTEKNSVLNPAFVLERDIETSTDAELADWCLSLGLESSGGRDVLAARLREHFKPKTPEAETVAPATKTPEPETALPETETPEPETALPETEQGTIPVESGESGELAGDAESADGTESSEEPLTITIISARNTEYFTVESVAEDYVRLSGGVEISIEDGEILHRIRAGQILYNRTRKFMSASGSVEYVKEEGDTVETFRGEGITVNLDNWSTAFMQGVSDHELDEGETSYRFAGEVISRSGEDSTVLRRAEITNGKGKESYWSIEASKLWLLPGSDWAVVNAVIKVGEIPVLWLPGFYYPADEIIFHPVLGYRAREGTFLQTTTYILGRPKATESSEESSITSIMGSGEGMEKVREGIFLRSTGQKQRDEAEPRLSLMADAYVNLGYFVGSELFLPPKGHFGEMLFSAGFGFSRDIALDYSGNYTPFFPDYDGTSEWHSSRLFDMDVPYRYRFVSTGSANFEGAAVRRSDVSWNLPFYSDPYVDNDFMDRSEDSSLFTLIRGATTPDMTVSEETPLSSYIWQFNGSLSFATAGMEPYINDLSINNAAFAVSFNTRTNSKNPPAVYLQYSPNRSFFYPDRMTLFSVPVSISGTPIVIGDEEAATGEDAAIPLWPNPVSPWETGDEAEEKAVLDGTELRPPSLTRELNALALGGHRFTLDYRFTPSVSSEVKFNSDAPNEAWTSPEDINWSDTEYQLYTIRTDGNIGLTLSEQRDLYTHSLRFYGSSSWQNYAYFNETVTPQRRESSETQARNMTRFSNYSEYVFTLRPFLDSDMWSTSNFRYRVNGLLMSGAYENDAWKTRAGSWDKEDIVAHQVQGNFSANVMDYMQNLSITADLPPEESLLAADATARVWISETNANTRVRDPFDVPYYEPVYLTETLRFAESISLVHSMVYDPELSEWTTVRTNLSWKNLTAGFTAIRSKTYSLEEGTGWVMDTEDERLNPYELTIGYDRTHTINEGGAISFDSTVNTGLRFDLQRYTYSRFYFTLGLGAHINNFVDIRFNSHSENAVVYRYFQNAPFFSSTDMELPGEKNLFIDLINSFRFDDDRKREASGFKLKSFELQLVHHLGDWDATLGVTLYPEPILNALRPAYRFRSTINFLVQWKPVSEFKTDIEYDTVDGLSYN